MADHLPSPRPDAPLPAAPRTAWTPGSHALLSVLVPGGGQLAQGRVVPALAQCGTVVAYLCGALAAGGGRALWLAVLWNAWSAVDAYLHGREE